MMRKLLGPACAGALAVGVSACDTSNKSNQPILRAGDAPATVALADVGAPLYASKPVPPKPTPPASAAVDPIIVRQCQVTLAETQNVPSKNSGRLLYFCTDIKPGEVVPPDQIIEHPRTKKQYRRLRVGETVEKGDLVGFLDDKLAAANQSIEVAAIAAGEARQEAAQQVLRAAGEDYQMNAELWKTRAVPESELRRSKAQFFRAQSDVEEAKGQLLKSREEFNKAKVILEEHEVRTTIPGTIKRFYRQPGESIKELDPIIELQNLTKLRVEGLVDREFLPLLAQSKSGRRELKVIIESAPQTAPAIQLEGHLLPVRAVAFTKDPNRSLIVSGSEDRTARVWDRLTKTQKAILPHRHAVRAVACSPVENLCLTGADDGMPRIWNLDHPEPTKTVREMKSSHQGRIVSAAFAPDGKTCVTADEQEIRLWDVATGELRYAFPHQHRGPITFVQYTPQSKLLSVAKDQSMCLWKLGDKGAAPEKMMEHRSGNVPVLNVSPDGQSVLFDQDRALHVVELKDEKTEGVLPAPSDASQFTSFALFSPDSQYILAAGTADNPLQLWKAPAPGVRAHMIRRLAVGPLSAPTCAAFSPDTKFAATGTQDNKVLVWSMPDAASAKQELAGTLTFTDSAVDAADRKARVWAELTNPGEDRLMPGDTVTLVIPLPETAKP